MDIHAIRGRTMMGLLPREGRFVELFDRHADLAASAATLFPATAPAWWLAQRLL
jgi:hypothetical protein